jgi:hypothetical protein
MSLNGRYEFGLKHAIVFAIVAVSFAIAVAVAVS